MNKTVLFVVNDLGFFFSHRVELGIAARKQGYQVAVATPYSDRVPELSALGFSYHPVAFSRSGLNPIKEIGLLHALVKLFRTVRPSVVHLVTVKPIVFGGIASRLAKVPAQVAAVPGLGFVYTNKSLKAKIIRPLLDFLYRIALNHKNSITIFQNQVDRQRFETLGIVDSKRTVLIKGSGADLSLYLPSATTGSQAKSAPIVMLACRMLYDKGVGTFVAVAQEVKRRNPASQSRFVLVGGVDTANPSAVPLAQLQEWDRSKVVEWWGQRNDMVEVFKQIDVACLPSVYGEGVPKVLIEACACAKPIVAMDIAGSRECVEHEVNGFLVQPGDIAVFVEAIEKLCQDPSLRERMGQSGRQRALKMFDVREVAATTVGIYDSLMLGK